MKKILHVASECTPFFKSGGLADVIGSLPKYLNDLKDDVRVILPLYGQLEDKYRAQLQLVMQYETQVGWRNQYTGIYELNFEGVHYYFIDNEQYFKRDRLYGFEDDGERFVYFSNAVIEFLYRGDFKPDILHGHDWQAAACVALCNIKKPVNGIKTVYTIHNILYQGWLRYDAFDDLFNVDRMHFGGFEWRGSLNLMKAGIFHADKITTVSPSYAHEIQKSYYGEGLEPMLIERQMDLIGIINGLDIESYNSMKDESLYIPFKTSIVKKRQGKEKLQASLCLPVNKDVPMFGIITRMVEQKGLDLLMHIMEEFLQQDVQVVVLGNGDYQYESYFSYLQAKYPNKMSVTIGFDEGFSRKIYAATDFFIMPSLFEPCGLSQLIALQYKSIPIVRETGGLRDTVLPFNEHEGSGTGLSFKNYNAHELLDRLYYALTLFKHEDNYKQIIKNISKVNNSWHQSALKYIELYEGL